MGNLISKSKKPNSPGGKTVLFDLFLISFLGLFFEVLIIRWLSAEVRLLAYFKNLPLMSCFLGLGISFALAKRKINFYSFQFDAFSPFVLRRDYIFHIAEGDGENRDSVWLKFAGGCGRRLV